MPKKADENEKKKEKKAPLTPEVMEEIVNSEETAPEELALLKDQLLRVAAEFENYKRRTEKEKDSLSSFVKANTIKALLPAIDNLSRALEGDKASPDYTKGVEMTIKGLMDTLATQGLSEINPENEPFNPEMHNAVMHTVDENYGENMVTEVLQKGYILGETVLRHAMVKVAN